MSFIGSIRSALPGSDESPGAPDLTLAADAKDPPRPRDLRCANPECDLFQLRLEADEVAPTPGSEPDRCASCGLELTPFG